MMYPPRFLIGHHPERGLLWAAIDGNVNYLEPRIAETRFGGYLAPFLTEDAARAALIEAGADPQSIAAEQRSARQRGRR